MHDIPAIESVRNAIAITSEKQLKEDGKARAKLKIKRYNSLVQLRIVLHTEGGAKQSYLMETTDALRLSKLVPEVAARLGLPSGTAVQLLWLTKSGDTVPLTSQGTSLPPLWLCHP